MKERIAELPEDLKWRPQMTHRRQKTSSVTHTKENSLSTYIASQEHDTEEHAQELQFAFAGNSELAHGLFTAPMELTVVKTIIVHFSIASTEEQTKELIVTVASTQ